MVRGNVDLHVILRFKGMFLVLGISMSCVMLHVGVLSVLCSWNFIEVSGIGKVWLTPL